MCVAADAACHGEVALQRRLRASEAEARGLAAEKLDEVGHVVIQREVAHGHEVEARVLLQRPMFGAQRGGHGLQLASADLVAPMLLQRELQLALRAHAREADDMSLDHVESIDDESGSS